jgi:Tfp pilus assembly protein PilV
MRINNLNRIKKINVSKLLLSVGLVIALCAGFTMSAQAQSSVARQQAQTDITTFYYGYKSNAIGKVNAEKRRGKYARMYYDNGRKQWAVDVSNSLTSGGNSGTTVNTTNSPTVADNQKRTDSDCQTNNRADKSSNHSDDKTISECIKNFLIVKNRQQKIH